MDRSLLWLVFMGFSLSYCASIEKNNSVVEEVHQHERQRAIELQDFLVCGLTQDVYCFLDTADSLVEQKKMDILAVAERRALAETGRAKEENSGGLTKAITKIISELTDIFKDSLSSFFKSDKDGEDDELEETDEEDDEKKDVATRNGELRGKKKKGKIIGLIKLVVFGVLLFLKIKLKLKLLAAALQVKFFLVALAGLILNAVRLWLDLKKKHQPQKVIYYEHAQHQHHYEGGEDEWETSAPDSHGYWGRSYYAGNNNDGSSAHDLAYAAHKPQAVYKKVKDDDQSSFSWFG